MAFWRRSRDSNLVTLGISTIPMRRCLQKQCKIKQRNGGKAKNRNSHSNPRSFSWNQSRGRTPTTVSFAGQLNNFSESNMKCTQFAYDLDGDVFDVQTTTTYDPDGNVV